MTVPHTDKLYFKIGEAAELVGLEPYVLRYWESEFKEIAPVKSRSRQRLYRKKDIETVLWIKKLLYDDGFTIEGAKKKLRGESPEAAPKQVPATPENQMDLGFRNKSQDLVLKDIKTRLMDVLKILESE